MRKLLSIFCIAVFSLLIGFGFANAEDMANKLGIGGRVLYYFPTEEGEIEDEVAFGEIEDDVAFGVNLTYIIIPNLSVELDWNYFKADVEDGDADIEVGELTTMPLMLIGQFRILTEGRVIPYVGAGVAYLFNEFDNSGEYEEVVEEVVEELLEEEFGVPFDIDADADIDVDDSWGFLLNAGVDFFLTDTLALNLDTKYLFSEASAEEEVEVEGVSIYDEIDDVDLSSFIIGAGIKYYFNL